MIATMQGVGAATSGLVAALVVDRYDYAAAFLVAGAAAAGALAALLIAMPETVAVTLPTRPSHEPLSGARALRHE